MGRVRCSFCNFTKIKRKCQRVLGRVVNANIRENTHSDQRMDKQICWKLSPGNVACAAILMVGGWILRNGKTQLNSLLLTYTNPPHKKIVTVNKSDYLEGKIDADGSFIIWSVNVVCVTLNERRFADTRISN